MIIKLLFAILLIIALSYVFSRFRRQDPAKRKKIRLKVLLYSVSGIVLLLIVTGRVHWITAIFAGLIPFLSRLIPLALQLLPFLRRGQRHGGPRSVLQTAYLRLQMDPNNGALSGEILSGPHAGKALQELSLETLNELLDYYQTQDPESHRLLHAYLQQINGGGHSANGEQFAGSSGNMSRREALEILGLDENASQSDIQQAHKKLMQRIHPDRGGSNYLAAKVNEAKTILLKKKA